MTESQKQDIYLIASMAATIFAGADSNTEASGYSPDRVVEIARQILSAATLSVMDIKPESKEGDYNG